MRRAGIVAGETALVGVVAFAAQQYLGIDHLIDANGDVQAQLCALKGGDLPAVVFDATLTLFASRAANRQDFENVLQTLGTQEIDISGWVTHRAVPARMIEEFPTWLNPASNVIKAMLLFE